MGKMIDIKNQKRILIQTINLFTSDRKRVIEIVLREYEFNEYANDIFLDGKIHASGISNNLIQSFIANVQSAILAGEL